MVKTSGKTDGAGKKAADVALKVAAPKVKTTKEKASAKAAKTVAKGKAKDDGAAKPGRGRKPAAKKAKEEEKPAAEEEEKPEVEETQAAKPKKRGPAKKVAEAPEVQEKGESHLQDRESESSSDDDTAEAGEGDGLVLERSRLLATDDDGHKRQLSFESVIKDDAAIGLVKVNFRGVIKKMIGDEVAKHNRAHSSMTVGTMIYSEVFTFIDYLIKAVLCDVLKKTQLTMLASDSKQLRTNMLHLFVCYEGSKLGEAMEASAREAMTMVEREEEKRMENKEKLLEALRKIVAKVIGAETLGEDVDTISKAYKALAAGVEPSSALGKALNEYFAKDAAEPIFKVSAVKILAVLSDHVPPAEFEKIVTGTFGHEEWKADVASVKANMNKKRSSSTRQSKFALRLPVKVIRKYVQLAEVAYLRDDAAPEQLFSAKSAKRLQSCLSLLDEQRKRKQPEEDDGEAEVPTPETAETVPVDGPAPKRRKLRDRKAQIFSKTDLFTYCFAKLVDTLIQTFLARVFSEAMDHSLGNSKTFLDHDDEDEPQDGAAASDNNDEDKTNTEKSKIRCLINLTSVYKALRVDDFAYLRQLVRDAEFAFMVTHHVPERTKEQFALHFGIDYQAKLKERLASATSPQSDE